MISSNLLWVVDMSLSIVYSFNRFAINRVHMLRAYWNSARNLCRIQSQVKYLLFSSLKSSFFSSSCFFASSCLVTCQMNSPKLNSTAENILKHFTNNAVETKFTSYRIHFQFFLLHSIARYRAIYRKQTHSFCIAFSIWIQTWTIFSLYEW